MKTGHQFSTRLGHAKETIHTYAELKGQTCVVKVIVYRHWLGRTVHVYRSGSLTPDKADRLVASLSEIREGPFGEQIGRALAGLGVPAMMYYSSEGVDDQWGEV